MTDAPSTPPAATPETQKSGGLSNRHFGMAALAVSIVALGFSVAPYLTGGDFGGRVRAYMLAHPQLLDEMVAARQANEDQLRVSQINQAVAANPGLLATDPRDPAFGPADAKVTVIEFFDYRCPGCKAVSRDYLALVRAHPDVRFVFKDWPILDREDDDTSNYAARAAMAAHKQGKYLAVYEALMAEPGLDRAGVDAILAANGVEMTRARADIASADTAQHLADIHTVAATLRLHGTPTFFVNGKVSAGIDPRDIARQIEAAKS